MMANGAKTLYTLPAGSDAEVDCSASRFSSCCIVGGWYSFKSQGRSNFDIEDINGENEQIECKLRTTKGKAEGCTEKHGCKIVCDTDCSCAGPFTDNSCGQEEIIIIVDETVDEIVDDINEKLNSTDSPVKGTIKKKSKTTDASGAAASVYATGLELQLITAVTTVTAVVVAFRLV